MPNAENANVENANVENANVENASLQNANVEGPGRHLRTIKLVIQYDGTGCVGWQRQATGVSIQGLIEDALSKIEGQPIAVHGAGRTDAGVHAVGQVAHARIAGIHDDQTMVRALNANLPEPVRVFDVQTVPDSFHARFDAVSKTYAYRIWNAGVVPPFVRLYAWHVPQPLDVDAMRRAAQFASASTTLPRFRERGRLSTPRSAG